MLEKKVIQTKQVNQLHLITTCIWKKTVIYSSYCILIPIQKSKSRNQGQKVQIVDKVNISGNIENKNNI